MWMDAVTRGWKVHYVFEDHAVLSWVLRLARKPVCVGWKMFSFSALYCIRARAMRSISLPMIDVSEIGRIFLGSVADLPGLRMGATSDNFHSSGSLPLSQMALNQFKIARRIVPGSFFSMGAVT